MRQTHRFQDMTTPLKDILTELGTRIARKMMLSLRVSKA